MTIKRFHDQFPQKYVAELDIRFPPHKNIVILPSVICPKAKIFYEQSVGLSYLQIIHATLGPDHYYPKLTPQVLY